MTHGNPRYVKLPDTPEGVKRLADFLRPALNEYGEGSARFQRFSSGGRDTATAMAEYIIRNLAEDVE